jgi:hypothetical protein
VGSADYEAILQWIRGGAPYGEEGGEAVRVTAVEVFPKEAVLDPKGKHQLLVTARLSNGRHRRLHRSSLLRFKQSRSGHSQLRRVGRGSQNG